jgi:dipeptidyl aminopeptidase/acylaminoacyl peptidase
MFRINGAEMCLTKTTQYTGLFATIAMAACILCGLGCPGAERPQRLLTAADLLNRLSLGESAWSPNGSELAYVIHHFDNNSGYTDDIAAAGDLWVASLGAHRPILIAKGRPSSVSWSPVWSPDGRFVAFATSDLKGTHLLVWDSHGGSARRIESAPLNVGYLGRNRAFEWVSGHEIVCSTYRDGLEQVNMINREIRDPALAVGAWKAAWGSGVTESILESGMAPHHEGGTVLLIDALSSLRRTLWEGPTVLQLTPSRDRRLIALITLTDRPQIDAAEEVKVRSSAYRLSHRELVIVDLKGRVVSRSDSFTGSSSLVLWSADNRKVAYVGAKVGQSQLEPQVQIQSAEPSLKSISVSLPCNSIPSLLWSSAKLLALCHSARTKEDSQEQEESYWFVVQQSGQVTRMKTPDVRSREVPQEIFAGRDDAEAVGLADGKVWLLDANSAAIGEFAISGLERVEKIVSPEDRPVQGAKAPSILLRGFAKKSTIERWYSLDLVSRVVSLVKSPEPDADVLSSSNRNNIAFYRTDSLGVWSLWLESQSSHQCVHLVDSQNNFLRRIAYGKERLIPYVDGAGRKVAALIILPAEYLPERRYPTVVVAYPGEVHRESDSLSSRPTEGPVFFNLQLLAAKGYLVLRPSIPLGPGDEPYGQLLGGVLPAVDKAIIVGLVDPNRVAIMGHSFGGFATYALISQTTRFQAAIAISGVSDFVSMYGTFSADNRYTSMPETDFYAQWWSEYGQGQMQSPPWEKPDRYIRNSPVFHADRITTPLLIIHGDLDFVPIQQAEEMYSALHRMNKRCRFIRYWDQWHTFVNPQSVRDIWVQIYAWLDEFLTDRSMAR